MGETMSNAEIFRFGAEKSTAQVAQALLRDGVVILDDVLPAAVVDRLSEKLQPHFDTSQSGGDAFMDAATSTVTAFWGIHPEFSEQLLLNQRILELADAVLLPENPMAASTVRPAKASYGARLADPGDGCLQIVSEGTWDPARGPNCHHYRLVAGDSIRLHPGCKDQPLHRDQGVWEPYVPNDPSTPQHEMIFNLAAINFTEANGATRFVPGSHLWPKERLATRGEVARAEMPKGAVAVWLGRTLHGYGANHTDVPRPGIIFGFGPDWLTQECNLCLAVPPEVARTLPLQAIQLLGYRAGGGNSLKGRNAENLLEPGKSGAL